MELILYSIGFCLFLVSLLVFIVIYSKRAIMHEQLAAKQMEIDHQKQLVEQNIEIQEEERNRIARELHDGINAKLATVILEVATIQDPEKSEAIIHSVKEVMDISRRIAYDLLPPTLEGFGLCAALMELFEPVIENSKIEVDLDLPEELDDTNPATHLHIYRIIQELVQNTLKHANATKIIVSGELNRGTFVLQYSDNGKGCKLESLALVGLGFRNIESRAQMIGATCKFKSQINEGFVMDLQLARMI